MKPGIDYIGVSAGAMIINDAGEVFLSKRSQNAKNEKGCWENPGGSVEFDETLEDAVKREIMEEYGVHIQIIKQFPAENHIIPAEKQHWVATTFLAKINQDEQPKIMEPEKCDAIGWFDLKHLPSPLSIITKFDLERYKNQNKKLNNYQQVAVGGAIFNDKDELLLVRRAENDNFLPGIWELPGGGTEYGETPEQGLSREIMEECGITITILDPFGAGDYFMGKRDTEMQRIEIIYLCSMNPSDQKVKLSHEHTEYAWISKDQRDNYSTTPYMRIFVDKAFEYHFKVRP
jgi:mutator protein MutT